MYTEDDKYTRKKKKNNANIYSENYYDEAYDYYKDYYADEENINENADNINKLNSNNKDNNNYLSKKDLFGKKYTVIIIVLLIVISVLSVFLIKTINVKMPPKGNSSNYIRLFYQELELKVGNKQKLDVTISKPSGRYKIEWFTRDENIVSVDSDGNIEAISPGETIILVAYHINGKIYDAQCVIRVLK